MSVATMSRRSGLGLVVAATSLGFVLVQLDVSILNVALARIGATLGTGVAGLQWVVDAYTIAFASLMLSAGALGDRIGARRAYMSGFILFVLASLGCGLAPGVGALVLARTAQGIGAALLVPCSLALLTHACRGDATARGRAISLWTAAASVALAAGPVVGGVLIETLGWRSIFFINLPVGAAGLWLTRVFVEDTPQRDSGFDWMGQVLALVTLLMLTGTMIEAGRKGFGSAIVLCGFAVAAIAGTCFVVVEARGRDPMLPLHFFRQPAFGSAAAVGLLINLTLYGGIFVLGLYLQQVRHYSPMASGFAFLPFPVALGLSNLASGRLGGWPRLGGPMAGGLLLGGLGFLLLRRLGVATSYAAMLPGLIVIPAGIGLAVPLMTSALLSTVPGSRSGVAAGVLNTVRQAGGGIGVALYGALMAARGAPGIQTAFMASAVLLAGGALIAATGIRPSTRSTYQPGGSHADHRFHPLPARSLQAQRVRGVRSALAQDHSGLRR
jgi:MFS transporter, DHA2 family, methylenomycin A resistance protein